MDSIVHKERFPATGPSEVISFPYLEKLGLGSHEL